MRNLLDAEPSRYLQQHAGNPVAWQVWGEEAFSLAREEGKPLLISIGYSSCHWCHVMAHESFENQDIADVINEHFVPVKVDREEYPDVDGFYMSFLSRLTGNGGWPLNVFVNPEGAPFYGLTYRQPESFESLLHYIAEEYGKKPAIQTQKIQTEFSDTKISQAELDGLLPSLSFAPYSTSSGPQFPQGQYLKLAWEHGETKMVAKELNNVIAKGLFDHIEGGWFRYSVDPDWKIPHFEKMLYDQAVLLDMCAAIYPHNRKVCDYAIRGAAAWLRDKMLLDSGLYGSATDADTDDGEGYYYTIDEDASLKEQALFRLASCGRHGHRPHVWIDIDAIESSQETLDKARNDRKHKTAPQLDPKAVFSWNAYLAAALIRCGEVTGDSEISRQARDLFYAISALPGVAEFDIRHAYYQDGSVRGNGYLEDYSAWLLAGTIAKKGIDNQALLSEIGSKFYLDGRVWHTRNTLYENQNMWQDTPFPSGGSLLLRAIAAIGTKADSKSGQMKDALRTSLAKIAVEHPAHFSSWLSGLFAINSV